MTHGSSTEAFSLFEGSPFPVIRRVLGVGRPDAPHLGRAVAIAVLATWVPLIALGTLQGARNDLAHGLSVLRDFAIHARFLVALPILLITPVALRDNLRGLIEQFSTAGLIKASAETRFISALTSSTRLRDSRLAEITALGLAFAWVIPFLIVIVPQLPPSWRTVEGGSRLSAAGWWWILVSQPVYVFVMIRFLYRVALWWRLLRQLSSFDLYLTAAHGDGAGGLAFLGLSLSYFALPSFAIAVSVAGGLANLVLWGGMSVGSYKYAIATFAVILAMLFAAPLLFFVRALSDARKESKLGYGSVAARQLSAYEKPRSDGVSPELQHLPSASEISAVRSLQTTVAAVYRMRVIPFERVEFLRLLVVGFLPFVPVFALEMPLQDLVAKLVKMVL